MQIHLLPEQFSGDPQSVAMLQAFYSRSTESIVPRLEKLGGDMSKVRKSLKSFYIGYGHNSIADCGTITLFVEGVSILAAKAIQEDPLYNGQECSTRYIRLTGELYDDNPDASLWMNLQRDVLAKLTVGVRTEHRYEGDIGDEKGHKIWENATAARAFDIARAWIPTGALTNLSVHMTLRKVNELTARLYGHPLPEVRMIAHAMRIKCVDAYPDACQPFTHAEGMYSDWLAEDMSLWYLNPKGTVAPAIRATRTASDGSVEHAAMGLFTEMKLSPHDALLINRRPRHAPLPFHFQSKATFTLNGIIDYACWRDLQRHRRQTGAAPMLTAEFGMNDWYYQQVRRYLHEADAEPIIETSEMAFARHREWTASDPSTPEHQYHLPIGTNVPFEYKFGLSQAFYLAELRSGNTVHAIIRPYAQMVGRELFRCGLRVDYDELPARFDIKRGTQTIHEIPQSQPV